MNNETNTDQVSTVTGIVLAIMLSLGMIAALFIMLAQKPSQKTVTSEATDPASHIYTPPPTYIFHTEFGDYNCTNYTITNFGVILHNEYSDRDIHGTNWTIEEIQYKPRWVGKISFIDTCRLETPYGVCDGVRYEETDSGIIIYTMDGLGHAYSGEYSLSCFRNMDKYEYYYETYGCNDEFYSNYATQTKVSYNTIHRFLLRIKRGEIVLPE